MNIDVTHSVSDSYFEVITICNMNIELQWGVMYGIKDFQVKMTALSVIQATPYMVITLSTHGLA